VPAAQLLHPLLEAGEVLDLGGLPIADGDLGPALQDRPDQLADHLLRVLVVAVGVHHDVGPELEGALHAVVERAPEPAGAGVVHELGDAVGACHLDGAVGRAVVDHQHHDLVDARDARRDRLEHGRQGLLLVQARDLDNESQRVTLCGPRPTR
jgi:hypothetical protein